MEMFSASAVAIFLLAIQQQNVTHHWYFSAAFTSFGIAFSQYHMFVGAARGTGTWWEMGLGGAVGVVLAMASHKRIREFRENASKRSRKP